MDSDHLIGIIITIIQWDAHAPLYLVSGSYVYCMRSFALILNKTLCVDFGRARLWYKWLRDIWPWAIAAGEYQKRWKLCGVHPHQIFFIIGFTVLPCFNHPRIIRREIVSISSSSDQNPFTRRPVAYANLTQRPFRAVVKRKSEGDIVSTRCSNVQYYLDSNLEWRGERGTTMSIKHGMIWWNFGGIYVFSKAFYPSNDRCKTNRKRCMKLRSRNLAPETAVALLCHHSFHSAQFSPMLHPDSQLLTSLNLFFETSTPSTSGWGACSVLIVRDPTAI